MSPSQLDLDYARKVLSDEAAAVGRLLDCVNDEFARAVHMIAEGAGQVVVTGIGKAGLIGAKVSATLASTGTPSIFLHPTEALHGDLGRLRAGDVVLALSHSGATQELIMLLDHLKRLGTRVIAITSEPGSPLAVDADVAVTYGKLDEACELGLAPSVSTTCMLALGDALALTAMRMRKFTPEDFAAFHPGGSLGLTFVRVERAMSFRKGDRLAVAADTLTIREVLAAGEAIPRRAGAMLLVNEAGKLTGILTDADLRRRLLTDDAGLLGRPVREVMVADPKSIPAGSLASEALEMMTRFRIGELPVLDADGRPIGLIDLKDLVGMGSAPDGSR